MDTGKQVDNARSGPGWGMAGLAITILLVMVLLLYRDTVLYVMILWNRWDGSELYSHGYLVLAICLYLIYRQRSALVRLTPCVNGIALVAVAATSLLWLAATVTSVFMVQTIALLLLILSVLWAALGSQVTRILWFPVLLLVFAIPVWTPLPALLQEVTAEAAFWVSRMIGVPVFRQEQLLILPAGSLAVNETCSGVSYLLAALTLGMLYAYLNYRVIWSRLLVVMIAGVAALLANIIRVVVVVQQAYVTDMQSPLVEDHFNLGWYLFGGLVFVLLLVDYGLSKHTGSLPADGKLQDSEKVAVCAYGYSRQLLVLAATGALLASGPVIAWWAQNQSGAAEAGELIMPAGAAGWSVSSGSSDTWMPVFHGAVPGTRAYHKDGHELYLYIGYYPKQEQGSEVIYYLNRISNDDLWRSTHLHGREVRTGGLTVLERELMSSSGKRRLVWYWYRVGGFDTSNQYHAKGLQLLGMLMGKPQASVLAVAMDIDDSGQTRQAMHGFISSMRSDLAQVADGEFIKNAE